MPTYSNLKFSRADSVSMIEPAGKSHSSGITIRFVLAWHVISLCQNGKVINVSTFNKAFFADLKNSNIEESLIFLPETFWPDLKAINEKSVVLFKLSESDILEKLGVFFDHWAQTTLEFLIAIENINAVDMQYGNESESDTLKELDNFLPKANERILASLENEIKKLNVSNPDNPLFCPVSLYQGIDGGRMEVSHTRTLGWLLDPKATKSHEFVAALMLKAFLEHADKAFADRITQVTSVKTEFVAQDFEKHGAKQKKNRKYGRLDIIIKCKLRNPEEETDGVVLVEAKVNVKKEEDQLEWYKQWLAKYCEENHLKSCNILMVFLSRNKGTDRALWKNLSYLELFESFSKVLSSNTNKHGYHFLRYYLAGIMMDILEWPLPISVNTKTEPFAWQLAVLIIPEKHGGTK